MIAFWNYNGGNGETLLSGEVTNINEEGGMVYVKSYAAWFKPLFVLPNEEGIRLKENLESLEESQRAMLDSIKHNHLHQRSELINGILNSLLEDTTLCSD